MKKLLIVVSILAFISLQSCKNIYYSGNSLEPGITFSGTTNATLELYVDTTVVLKGSSTSKVVFGIFKSSDNVFSDSYFGGIADQEKRAAMYKALQNTNYDLIVLPKYIIETKKGLFSRSTTCYVEGYGGKYILKNAKYINNSIEKKVYTEINEENPVYRDAIQKLMIFMDNLSNYAPIEIRNPAKLAPNDIIRTAKGYYGVVLAINNDGIITYITKPTQDKFEVQNDKYSNLIQLKKQ